MPKLRIGILGANGRMGTAARELLLSGYAERVDACVSVSGSEGTIDELADTDAVIDFSLPAGTGAMTDLFLSSDDVLPVVVCGTTGLSDEQRAAIEALGEKTKVIYSTNFSFGVAAVKAILEFASPMLRSTGYRPVMTETHHALKLDSPSGTALTLAKAIDPDTRAAVDIRSVREGDVIGQHHIVFEGPSDRISVGHEALNRNLFAAGAIEAAFWLCEQPEKSGYYGMGTYFNKRFLA